jgi:hypothetical protein
LGFDLAGWPLLGYALNALPHCFSLSSLSSGGAVFFKSGKKSSFHTKKLLELGSLFNMSQFFFQTIRICFRVFFFIQKLYLDLDPDLAKSL